MEREKVLVLRYWQLVSHPDETLNRVARFLGIAEDLVTTIPRDNARPFVQPGLRASVLGRVIRAGAATASYAPPDVWRRVSKPFVSLLQHGGPTQRPKLASVQRTALLERLLGRHLALGADPQRVVRGLAVSGRPRLLCRAETERLALINLVDQIEVIKSCEPSGRAASK